MLRKMLLTIFSVITIAGCSSSGSGSSPPEVVPPEPPPEPEIVQIELGPVYSELDVGTFELYTVSAIDSEGARSNVSTEATYSLQNDSGIVEIRSNNPDYPNFAFATAITPGQDTIVATLGDLTSTADVVVNESRLISLTVSPQSEDLPVGGEEQFSAEGEYDDGHTQDLTDESSWSSSNINVATISESGLLSALEAGTTTITASFDGQLDTASVVVRDPEGVVSIEVTPGEVETMINATEQFDVIATYADGSMQSVTSEAAWTSSDTGVMLSIRQIPGRFQATSEGTATITAAFAGYEDTSEATVADSFGGTIEIEPRAQQVQEGDYIQYSAVAFDSSGEPFDVTESDATTFSVDDTTFLGISNAPGKKGLAQAKRVGNTQVRATFMYGESTFVVETLISIIP